VARIAAVADSFDAMTSGRAYRRGGRLSMDAAVAELERCSGTQFDPEVVQAFLVAVAAGAIPDTHRPPTGELAAFAEPVTAGHGG
jgi:HD-GYP domain-containing protein (c-di-GMP phosphodiesterase class II)